MALYKTEAIVLRTLPLGEADRLLVLLSPDRGKIRAVAKGVSRPRSRLAAAVQPFTYARYVLWSGRELDGVSQAEIVETHRRLCLDVQAMAAASYCCEISDALWQERQEAAGAFATLLGVFGLLAAGDGVRSLVLRWFELRATTEAGFAPRLDACAGCGGGLLDAQRYAFSPTAGGLVCSACQGEDKGRWIGRSTVYALRYLSRASPDDLKRTTASPTVLDELGRVLAAHLGHTLQRPLRSRALLDELQA